MSRVIFPVPTAACGVAGCGAAKVGNSNLRPSTIKAKHTRADTQYPYGSFGFSSGGGARYGRFLISGVGVSFCMAMSTAAPIFVLLLSYHDPYGCTATNVGCTGIMRLDHFYNFYNF